METLSRVPLNGGVTPHYGTLVYGDAAEAPPSTRRRVGLLLLGGFCCVLAAVAMLGGQRSMAPASVVDGAAVVLRPGGVESESWGSDRMGEHTVGNQPGKWRVFHEQSSPTVPNPRP